MAQSKTSLEIDSLTVETLFNRGSLLSSSQAYIPILSSIGTFSIWTSQPVSSIFYNYFRSYSTPGVLLNPISTSLQYADNISGSLNLNLDTINRFSNTSISTLILLSNLHPSTIDDLTSSYSTIYKVSNSNNSTVSSIIRLERYGIISTGSNFMKTNFSPNASTLINLGNFYYLQRPVLTPPIPWYWAGMPSRYIGPGLSSLSTLALTENRDLLLSTYVYELSTLSTSWYDSNVFIEAVYVQIPDFLAYSQTLIETGSSLNSLYNSTNSTVFGYLTISTYYDVSTYSTITRGTHVSTFSTVVSRYLTNSIPSTYGQFISSANSSIFITLSTGLSTSISTIRSASFLPGISTLSTVFTSSILSTNTQIPKYNIIPGLCTIVSSFTNTLLPAYDVLYLCTNINGFYKISSLETTMFSTFSTTLPAIIGSSVNYNLDFISKNISSISTNIVLNRSTIYSINESYMTAQSLSSMSSFISTQIGVAYTDYSSRISTSYLSYITPLAVANSIPGLSSLYKSGSAADYSTISYIMSINKYVNTLYFIEQSNYYSSLNVISTGISQNVVNFISAGTLALIGVNFSFSNASTVFAVDSLNISSYIDYFARTLINNIQNELSNTNDVVSSFLQTIALSNSYFKMLRTIPDYSTNVLTPPIGYIPNLDGSGKPRPFPGFLTRSTNFYSITASTLNIMSSLLVTDVNIQGAGSNFNLSVKGGTSIQPYTNPSTFFVTGNYIYLQTPATYTPITNTVYGSAVVDNTLVIANAASGSYKYNQYTLMNSKLNMTPSSITNFYSDQAILNVPFNYTLPTSFYNQSNYNIFSQISSGSNTLFYISTLSPIVGDAGPPILSTTLQTFRFSSLSTSLATYSTMGPLTSITTNGSQWLLTGTSNTFASYLSNWNPPNPENAHFYTMILTSNVNIGTATQEQFSTPMISAYPTEFHTSIWTGKGWVAAGDGAYISENGINWIQTLPTRSERLLQYRSMDFNGQEILMANISSCPLNIEFVKSVDGGASWTTASIITMPDYTPTYTDLGGVSTGIYSVNVKWAFNQWNAFITPLHTDIPTGTTPSFRRAHFYSLTNGSTWLSNAFTNIVNVNTDTSAPVFDPVQVITPSIQLPNFSIYARDDPIRTIGNQSLSVRFSSIVFNEGDLTLKRRYNSQLTGVVGINTVTPVYSLDIAIGEARKPSGTQWITGSDKRIKAQITNANTQAVLEQVSSLRLVTHTWTEPYRSVHGLSDEPTLGFLSQEVEKVFPSSVYLTDEAGFSNFRSLELDQLYKAKYGLTRQLLFRASTLQSRINNLLK